jgi:hypothetical protein
MDEAIMEQRISLRFDPRTVQSVASRYTDWAIPAHSENMSKQNKQKHLKDPEDERKLGNRRLNL